MPFRNYGKSRRTNYRKRRFTRHSASGSIARAWKAKKRRKAGLYERTVLQNRRQLKVLKKSVETKVMQNTQADGPNQFCGQYQDNILVDNTGQETIANIPFAGDLLCLNQGVKSDERIGDWIQLTSLTMHYCICLPTTRGTPDCWYELFIVLDRSPLLGASLGTTTGVLALSSAAPPPPNWLTLAFQNLSETGKDGRWKILARKKHRLNSTTVTPVQVPAIAPALPPATFGSARPSYLGGVLNAVSKPSFQYVNGSINLKLNHKINYGPAVSVQPSNQTLRIMAFQCNPAGIVQPLATLQYYTRIRFKDA